MYIPSSFAETDLTVLHDFIEQHSFGLLISQVEAAPFATHIPFLLDRDAGANGTLIGHVARANPHWKHFADQTSLAIFNGPHSYISPTWYGTENVVPTWNYMAVHAYGRVELVEDDASLLEILQKTVSLYERNMPSPWTFDPSSTFIAKLLPQIVGFRIAIAKIEGKFKLNQNHPVERRQKVVDALAARGSEDERAIAEAMRPTLVEG